MFYSDVMEPLSPNDPLFNLLGKAKAVEPRANFTQNVMRAVRQVPQSLGVWERVSEWFGSLTMPRFALAGAAVLVAGVLTVGALQKPGAEVPAAARSSPAPVVAAAPVQPAIYHVSATLILAATAEPTPAPATTPATVADDMDPMRLLLVQEDTSALTDSELALLVY